MRGREFRIMRSISVALASLVLIFALSGKFPVPALADGSPRVMLVFDRETRDSIEPDLDIWINDLRGDGYVVDGFNWLGPYDSPNELKQVLVDLYNDPGRHFQGMIFIGDLPVAWYECTIHGEWERFPVDLYWMDMNGVWTDEDGDGWFDGHSGHKTPEVWMGRLTASAISWGQQAQEAQLLRTYFQRNHEYRERCSLSIEGWEFRRALVYVDDDMVGYPWSYDPSITGLSMAFSIPEPSWDLITDPATTTAEDYRNRIASNRYALIHLLAHSSYRSHCFHVPGGEGPCPGGKFHSNAIPITDPLARFYLLCCCYAARYTEYDNMAGRYIFDTTWGLVAIGLTRSGGLPGRLDLFFTPFAHHTSIGQSFLEWLQGIPYPEGAINVYGITLQGDPTLKRSPYVIPTVIGGASISITKLAPLDLYLGTTATIIVATVATAIFIKRIKRRKENQ